MKFTILKLTAFAMLATASSVFASEDDHAVQSLRGSTSASSDEDSADEELYGWNGNPWWSGNSNNLQTCTSNCQCPEGEEDSRNTVSSLPLVDIYLSCTNTNLTC